MPNPIPTASPPEIAPTTVACCFSSLTHAVAQIQQHWNFRWPQQDAGICVRGSDQASFDLNPSLLRFPYNQEATSLALQENNLWQELRRRSLPLLGRLITCPWESMCVMQQHGLPTRLLDWSRTLAVGAYFAVRDVSTPADGAVWVMAARHLLELRHIADAWRLSSGSPVLESLALRSGTDGLDAFTAQTPVVLDPDRVVDRLVAQHGLYSLHSFQRHALEHLALIDRARYRDACFLHKLIIPAAKKGGLRSELFFLAGITEASLFPDMDGFARDYISAYRDIAQKPVAKLPKTRPAP